MTALNHTEQYRDRIRSLIATRDAQRQRSALFSALRLGIVLATAFGGYLTWPSAVGVTAVLLPGVAVFLFILKQHQRVKRALRHTEALIRLNEWEVAAQGGDHSNFDDGSAFRQLDHPFAHDLDVFGPRSIFQLINRTSTASGQGQLADWLQAPCTDSDQLRQRQEAVAELTPQLDWRQDLWAVGMQFGLTGGERDGLLQWVQRPVTIAQGGLYTVLLWLLPALALGSLAAHLLGAITFMQFLVAPVALLAFVGAHVKKVNREMEEVSRMHEQLEGYARLWQLLEDQQPNAPFLKSQRDGLRQGPRPATKAIRHLGNILESLDVRNNPIGAMVVNGLFLWDLHHMRRLAAWKARYREHLATWFAVTGTWDALCSLAQLAYNRPDFTYPEFRETGNELQLEGAGHPLMRPGTCTLNDWGLSGRAQLTILTGANMAGKSTFLRMVGVNMMLAMAGGPVFAKRMVMRPMPLFTSMRTADSLQENASYFYQELQRLKALIDALQQGVPYVILLDEILKGTNSKDKATGSRAFVDRLMNLQAMGVIATHDLSLCQAENSYPGQVHNQCFEVFTEGDQLDFDYQLRPGVCQRMNATFLMRQMGITEPQPNNNLA